MKDNKITKQDIANVRTSDAYETIIFSQAGRGVQKKLVVVAAPFSAGAQCFFRVYDHGRAVLKGGSALFMAHEFDIAVEFYNNI